jgi:hypothetical protein
MTWTRISGGYCPGIAFGRDTRSGTVEESSDDVFGGRSLRGLFPVAIFLMALRTEAIVVVQVQFSRDIDAIVVST